MNKLKSKAKCFYCDKLFAGGGISRHLKTHLEKLEEEQKNRHKSFHVKVVGEQNYFLHLLIHEAALLDDLDSFLRQIWVECCGHLSSFQIKGKRKMPEDIWSSMEDDYEYGLDKRTKIGGLFRKGLKLEYEYDFGSTTYLEIQVMNEYFVENKDKILLLSRNEPLPILCELCEKQPATVTCTMWHEDETVFCDSCKKKHAQKCSDFEDYGEMPIVNSPRFGVCGYEGGSIDTERDGIWKK